MQNLIAALASQHACVERCAWTSAMSCSRKWSCIDVYTTCCTYHTSGGPAWNPCCDEVWETYARRQKERRIVVEK